MRIAADREKRISYNTREREEQYNRKAETENKKIEGINANKGKRNKAGVKK